MGNLSARKSPFDDWLRTIKLLSSQVSHTLPQEQKLPLEIIRQDFRFALHAKPSPRGMFKELKVSAPVTCLGSTMLLTFRVKEINRNNGQEARVSSDSSRVKTMDF